MSRQGRSIRCAHCGSVREHSGRGLCNSCRQGFNGCNPNDYERTTYTAAELVEEWNHLSHEGLTRRGAADRLGITKARLEKAIERHTRRTQEIDAA